MNIYYGLAQMLRSKKFKEMYKAVVLAKIEVRMDLKRGA
jgi:hypothetical protein